MLPLLSLCGDGQEHSNSEALDYLSNLFNLTSEEREARSGRLRYIDANFSWAKTYLKKAGLIEYSRTRYFRITNSGTEVLKSKPARIDKKYLSQFGTFKTWNTWDDLAGTTQAENPNHKSVVVHHEVTTSTALPEESDRFNPEEQVERGHTEIRATLADELLEKCKSCHYSFFEHLVVDLLVGMGYGGFRKGAGQVVGKTADGGIDGLINEDKLGLNVIYMQAKRWNDGPVDVGSVRDFAGSLDAHGAKKGVFITTSRFTSNAKDFVTRIGEKKIVLIDGFELAQLMIDHDIGVSTVTTYTIKRLDSDYFEE